MISLQEKTMLIALALAGAAPATQDFQSTEMLDTIVAQFTGKTIGDLGGAQAPVDKRLKLAQCTAPQLDWRTDAHDAVVIRCMAPAWRIFVPVNAAPRPKPVAQPAPGASTPIRAAAPVKAEPVIRRGDAVRIEAGAPGFSITREGVAANDAAPGARVSIKVEGDKAPIQAIALEPGRARLPGWED